MTQEDYILVAEAICTARLRTDAAHQYPINIVVNELIAAFVRTDPDFNADSADRFQEACSL